MAFATNLWAETPDDLGANLKRLDELSDEKLQAIEIQIDEMWSFVDYKRKKKWIWVVYCPALKQTLAVHFGGRTKADLKAILDQLPKRVRDNCKFATDHFESYYQLIPANQHRPGKEFTYFIEGYFAGVRARVSRLVRKALSFSKDLNNHIAAIRYFLWQRNLDCHPYIWYTPNNLLSLNYPANTYQLLPVFSFYPVNFILALMLINRVNFDNSIGVEF